MATASSSPQDPFLRDRYDRMCSPAMERIQSGSVEIDPFMARREGDPRRGMTLIVRPSVEVRGRVVEFLSTLREIEPAQSYYESGEMHLTFLSLITAAENNEHLFSRTQEYTAGVEAGVRRIAPFPLAFTGLTASAGAIMVQGFTCATILNAARDELRRELQARGLGENLDQRYRLETAHMTVVRFGQPLRDGKALADIIEMARAFPFGQMEVQSLELVKSDWYMSHQSTESLGQFSLARDA